MFFKNLQFCPLQTFTGVRDNYKVLLRDAATATRFWRLWKVRVSCNSAEKRSPVAFWSGFPKILNRVDHSLLGAEITLERGYGNHILQTMTHCSGLQPIVTMAQLFKYTETTPPKTSCKVRHTVWLCHSPMYQPLWFQERWSHCRSLLLPLTGRCGRFRTWP